MLTTLIIKLISTEIVPKPDSIEFYLKAINESLNKFDINLIVGPLISVLVVYLTLRYERQNQTRRDQLLINNSILNDIRVMLSKHHHYFLMPKPQLRSALQNLHAEIITFKTVDGFIIADRKINVLFMELKSEIDKEFQRTGPISMQIDGVKSIVSTSSKLFNKVENLSTSVTAYTQSLFDISCGLSFYEYDQFSEDKYINLKKDSVEKLLNELDEIIQNPHPGEINYKILLNETELNIYKDV